MHSNFYFYRKEMGFMGKGLVNVVTMVIREKSEDHSVSWKTEPCSLDNCIIEAITLHVED